MDILTDIVIIVCSANPGQSKKAITHASGKIMLYGKFDLKITCGSRVMSIYSLNENGQTHIVITVLTQGSCN